MLTENPGVAVGYSGSGEPSLETGVFQAAEVGVEELDVAVPTADVVFTAMEMHSDEMTGHAVAEPVADAGLHEPVFPLAVVAQIPGVETDRNVDGPFGGHTELRSDVGV